jgi:hypothetical protein
MIRRRFIASKGRYLRRGMERSWRRRYKGMTVYGLSKILGWSTGKVYHSIKRLGER